MNFRLFATILALLAFCTSANAQAIKEIDLAFAQKKYEVVLADCRAVIAREPANPYPYGLIGSVYIRESKYDSSLPFLQKAIELDNDSTWISGWAHTNLGNAYLYLGQRDKAISELKIALGMAATPNNLKATTRILDSIGYDIPEKTYPKDYLPNWVVIQGPHAIYKFQDTAGLHNQVYKFILKHELAYETLAKIFEPKLPSKLIMHIWEDKDVAKKILHQSPGFSVPKQCFVHIQRDQSLGYQTTQVLSYWAWGTQPTDRSLFINVGIGRCFNLEDYDKLAAGRIVAAKEKIHDVMDVWENDKKYDSDVLFPIAGAFVAYLRQNSTEDEFRQVVKQQSIDKVKIIYGARFNKLVTDFNQLMGMK